MGRRINIKSNMILDDDTPGPLHIDGGVCLGSACPGLHKARCIVGMHMSHKHTRPEMQPQGKIGGIIQWNIHKSGLSRLGAGPCFDADHIVLTVFIEPNIIFRVCTKRPMIRTYKIKWY